MRNVCSWQHQSTVEKTIIITETLHKVYILCDKSNLPGKKTSLSQLLTVCRPYWTNRMQNKVTINYCQDKEGQPIRIFCFTHTKKSIRYASLLAEDGCPVLQKNSGFGPAVSAIFHNLEIPCLHYLLS